MRFTVSTMLISVAVCTLTLWAVGLPGRRIQRLVRLIGYGEAKAALAMSDDLPGDALQYRMVIEHVASHPPATKATRDVRRINTTRPRKLVASTRDGALEELKANRNEP